MLCVSFCGNHERRASYSACANLPLVTICVGIAASSNVEGPNRMTRFWIVSFWHSFSSASQLIGTLFFAALLTPALLLRTFVTQAFGPMLSRRRGNCNEERAGLLSSVI
jgi:uncharacterized membrane protein